MTELNLSAEMVLLLNRIRDMAANALALKSLQENIVEAIARALPYYSWIGFYMLASNDPETLILGPFVGDPTPHVRISINQGICGAAVTSGKTVIVDDVNADPRYLSCSVKTKSEIVTPIYAHGSVVGEIDIDSHTPAAFTDVDRVFLEEVTHIVGSYIELHPNESLPGYPRPGSARS